MKKTIVALSLICALVLGGCQNLFTPTPGPGPGPTVDTVATGDALFQTAIAQTLTAQPTSTAIPATATPTAVVAVASPTLPPTDTPLATAVSATPVVDLTTTSVTATGSIPTATGGPTTVSGTATPTLVTGQVTAIWTLAIRKYGTLPPAVPFSSLTLVNKANAEAYISLQVTMPDGKYSVIEYPVKGTVKIQAPVGSYLYVAWVGGNKLVGNFRLHNDDDFSIFLYKDKVVIK